MWVLCHMPKCKKKVNWLSSSIVIAYINKFSDFHSTPETVEPAIKFSSLYSKVYLYHMIEFTFMQLTEHIQWSINSLGSHTRYIRGCGVQNCYYTPIHNCTNTLYINFSTTTKIERKMLLYAFQSNVF
jgi:hypothetical protein